MTDVSAVRCEMCTRIIAWGKIDKYKKMKKRGDPIVCWMCLRLMATALQRPIVVNPESIREAMKEYRELKRNEKK